MVGRAGARRQPEISLGADGIFCTNQIDDLRSITPAPGPQESMQSGFFWHCAQKFPAGKTPPASYAPGSYKKTETRCKTT